MSNLEKIPLQDGFRTSLSQSWDGATGTVYVAKTPTFTFPSGVTTYIVVNAGKSNMQIAEINAYNATTKTITVNNITLEKGASISSTAQTHAVGSEVIISDNYQFWKDIYTAINSKMNLDDDNIVTAGKTTFTSTSEAQLELQNVTTAQRTALTGISNGTIVYDTDLGELYQYTGGAWSAVSSGSTQPNASTTVAGKVEIATAAERAAGTSTGGTGALLVVSNDALVKTPDLTPANDENKVPVLNASGKVDAFVTQTSEKTTITSADDTDLVAIGDDENIAFSDLRKTLDNTQYTGFTPSDTLIASADTERTNATASFVKVKEIRLGRGYKYGGSIRVKYDYKSTSGAGDIKFDVNVGGTEPASTTHTNAGTSYTSVSVDVAAEELWYITLWTKDTGTVRNLRVYYDEVAYTKTPTVNQD